MTMVLPVGHPPTSAAQSQATRPRFASVFSLSLDTVIPVPLHPQDSRPTKATHPANFLSSRSSSEDCLNRWRDG